MKKFLFLICAVSGLSAVNTIQTDTRPVDTKQPVEAKQVKKSPSKKATKTPEATKTPNDQSNEAKLRVQVHEALVKHLAEKKSDQPVVSSDQPVISSDKPDLHGFHTGIINAGKGCDHKMNLRNFADLLSWLVNDTRIEKDCTFMTTQNLASVTCVGPANVDKKVCEPKKNLVNFGKLLNWLVNENRLKDEECVFMYDDETLVVECGNSSSFVKTDDSVDKKNKPLSTHKVKSAKKKPAEPTKKA